VNAPALVASVVLGALGGVVAAWVADTVLAARDDAPPPGPRWLAAASALVGAGLFPLSVVVAGEAWLVPAFAGFALLTLTLALTDLRAQLIPDRINLPGSVACALRSSSAPSPPGSRRRWVAPPSGRWCRPPLP
jgi:hypothetical protein